MNLHERPSKLIQKSEKISLANILDLPKLVLFRDELLELDESMFYGEDYLCPECMKFGYCKKDEKLKEYNSPKRTLGFSLFLVFFLCLSSCNEKKNKQSVTFDVASNKDTLIYNLKGFLNFSRNTTLNEAISYFEENRVKYILNPDFSSPELGEHNVFRMLFTSLDPPLGKLIYLQNWQFLGLVFKEVLFGFYKDTLSFIDIYEGGGRFYGGEISKLKKYYEEKYGDADYEKLTEVESWTYKNERDDITVQFLRNNRPFWDEFTISFPAYNLQDIIWRDKINHEIQDDKQREIERKKSILDSL